MPSWFTLTLTNLIIHSAEIRWLMITNQYKSKFFNILRLKNGKVIEWARFFKIQVIKVKKFFSTFLTKLNWLLKQVCLKSWHILNFIFYINFIITRHTAHSMQSDWLDDYIRGILRMYSGLGSLSALWLWTYECGLWTYECDI